MDATVGLIGRAGFEGVNIAAVAAAAGVTRQTVYSIFGTREDLVSQAVAGLLVDVLGDIRARLSTAHSPVAYVVELVVAGRAAIRDVPVLGALLHAGDGNPLFDPGMIARAKPIARELLSPILEYEPALGDRLDDIVEIALRLGMSVVIFDDDAVHADDDLRRFLTRWLAPAMTVEPVGRADGSSS
ncbi:TetR family transcriptional regulator [Rhodococcus sp. OK519]|nr:TetR family transcriptional regulator [Rhodococcus sp. OK519]